MHYIKKYYFTWENPLFVIFDIAQSNSEHCRHHFFNGNIYIDNVKQEENLFQLVKKPLKLSDSNNSLVAFSDNSSVIKGYKCNSLKKNFNCFF